MAERDGTRPTAREPDDPESAATRGRAGASLAPALVILLVVGAAFVATLRFDDVPAFFDQGISPAQFPQLVLGLIAVLAVLMAVAEPSGTGGPGLRGMPMQVPLSILATFLFIVLVRALGQRYGDVGSLLGTFAYCVMLPAVWGERRWQRVLLFAAGFSAAVWLLFVVLLDAPLPGR